jgi:beta-lactamase class D
MKNLIAALLISLFSACALANTPDIAEDFQGKSACFILFDLNQNKLVEKYNPTRCAKRITPASTFKVPLSLMAFDQKLITQETIFKWDGREKDMAAWNVDQTPQTWLKNSVVWVSQTITPQLGITKIKSYLKKFHYGNQDFSGDPGINNGLTHAWLSSSLKISANEQFKFVKALVTNKLPVSHQAMIATKANMFRETSPNGYQLYGKTGSGSDLHHPIINNQHQLEHGWFIGFLEKGKQKYVFVLNFSDLQPPQTTDPAGLRAKAMTKLLLTKMGLY